MGKKWYNFFVTVQPSAEDSDTGEAPLPEASAARTVADIAAGLGAPPTFAKPVGDPDDFAQVYEAAEIRPPSHGYTIFKIAEMLQSEHIRNLPAGVKKSSILVALDASGVKLDEVIEDAVRRDRALDTYERVQQRGLSELESRKNEESAQIQRELDTIVAERRARMQANAESVARAREKLQDWSRRKQHEEQRIADAVSYFVTENPITIASSAPDVEPPPRSKGQD